MSEHCNNRPVTGYGLEEVAQASRMHLDKAELRETVFKKTGPTAFYHGLAFYTHLRMLRAQGYVRQAISSSPRSSTMYVNNTCPVSGYTSGADTARTTRKIKSFLQPTTMSPACPWPTSGIV